MRIVEQTGGNSRLKFFTKTKIPKNGLQFHVIPTNRKISVRIYKENILEHWSLRNVRVVEGDSPNKQRNDSCKLIHGATTAQSSTRPLFLGKIPYVDIYVPVAGRWAVSMIAQIKYYSYYVWHGWIKLEHIYANSLTKFKPSVNDIIFAQIELSIENSKNVYTVPLQGRGNLTVPNFRFQFRAILSDELPQSSLCLFQPVFNTF